MGALGEAIGIGKKIFKGLRARRKKKRLDRKKKRLDRKEAEARKALSNLIAGGTDTNSYSTPLTADQLAAGLTETNPNFEPSYDLGMGSFRNKKRGLENYNINSTEDEEPMQAGFNIKTLPMWAKIAAGVVALFVAYKLFTKKKRR